MAVTYAGTPNVTRTFSITPDATGEGRLLSPLKYKVSVRTWVQSDRTISTVSNIILCNADGELDGFEDEEFIDFQISEDVDGTTTDLAYGLIDRAFLSGDVLKIKLKDATKQLDKPIQDNLFPATVPVLSGIGNRDTYALEGMPKPLCVANIARLCKPVLVNRSNNEYMLHDEDVFNVVEVFDRGVSVSFTQVDGGFYLAADNDGQVTADVRGQETADDSSRLKSFNEIMEYFLDTRESISYSSSDCDTINTDKGYNYSYYQDNQTNRTIREVLKLFCDSHTGWFYTDETGVLRFGYLDEPAVSADVEISQYQVIGNWNNFDDTASNLSAVMGGGKNFFVYSEDEIAASVGDEDTITFTVPYRLEAEGANTLDSFYTSTGIAQETMIGTPNAQSEADHVTSLYSQKRKFYTFDSSVIADIGDTVELTHPRYGLSGGVNLLCVGKEIDFINMTYRLTLWG